MKEFWNKYWDQLETTDETFERFLSNAELSPQVLSNLKPFISEWNKSKKMAADMDVYISPMEPLNVKLPFESAEFSEMWARWKEYITEQHGQMIRSRAEKSALEHLQHISNKDVAKAIFILRFAMTGRYKNFFEVDEKTATQTTIKSNKQSDFD